MSTMNVSATISARDLASPVFQRIAQNAAAASKRFSSVAGSFGNLGNAMSMGMAGVGAGFGGFSMAAQYEVDKVRTAIKSVGEITGKEFAELDDAAKRSSLTYGNTLKETLGGVKELIQGGIPANLLAASLDQVGMAARAN